MRLPWPFRRSDPPDSPAPGPAESVPPAERPNPRAWASLPPIQRTVGEPPLVAPAEPFLERVPGAHPLPPIVQPLAHEVSHVAPPGLVVAMPRSVPTLTSNVALTPRPVPARHRTIEAEPGSPSADLPVAPSEPSRGPSPAVQALESASGAAPPLAPRSLQVVPAEAIARAPSHPLTRADPPTPAGVAPVGGRPVVSRRMQTEGAGSVPSPNLPGASTGQASLPGMRGGRRPGLGAPLPTAAGTGATPPATTTTTSSGSSAAPSAAAVPSSAPLPGTPARPAMSPRRTMVQRRAGSPTSGHVPAGDGAAAAAGRHDPGAPAGPNSTGATSLDTPGPAPTVDDRSALSRLPVLRVTAPLPAVTVARSIDPARAAPSGDPLADAGGVGTAGRGSPPAPVGVASTTGWAAAARPGTSSAAGPATGRVPTRPLVSRRSLATADVPVPRPTGDDAPSGMGPASTPAELGDADTGLTGGNWPGMLPGAAPGMLPGAWSGEAPAGQSTALPGPIQRFATARSAGGGSPAWPTGGSDGGRLRLATGPIARPATSAAPPAETGAAAAPTIARSIVAAPAAPTTGQGQPAGGPGRPVEGQIGPVATAIVQRVDGAAPPPPSEPAGHSEDELDELARALFGRFRNRLRTEYIHEREARGRTFDNV